MTLGCMSNLNGVELEIRSISILEIVHDERRMDAHWTHYGHTMDTESGLFGAVGLEKYNLSAFLPLLFTSSLFPKEGITLIVIIDWGLGVQTQYY